MLTVLAMGWNQRKVESLHKTLAKRFVKVRSLYCMWTFTLVILWSLLVVLNIGIIHMLTNEKVFSKHYSLTDPFFVCLFFLTFKIDDTESRTGIRQSWESQAGAQHLSGRHRAVGVGCQAMGCHWYVIWLLVYTFGYMFTVILTFYFIYFFKWSAFPVFCFSRETSNSQ